MICLLVPFNTDFSPNSHISVTIPSTSIASVIYIPDTALIYFKGSPPAQLTTLGVVVDKSEGQQNHHRTRRWHTKVYKPRVSSVNALSVFRASIRSPSTGESQPPFLFVCWDDPGPTSSFYKV